ncbi:hypothetical protein IV203_001069 [Nitzschia inconspicua]|uniref:Uncharacterized protein n=1 Tax=Nitzschia inconspicua TaxID=303405 RepID=A0A9K3PRA5_9STRA|nr:hypothetical protein IV203_001069 [Nitzschia inconspicua]
MKLLSTALLLQAVTAFVPGSSHHRTPLSRTPSHVKHSVGISLGSTSDDDVIAPLETISRRNFMAVAPTAAWMVALGVSTTSSPSAVAATGASDGNLPDLPRDAVRSYLQYRIPLQIAADYYIFSLQSMVGDIEQWGDISQLFRVNNNKGQGQPSRIERDYNNPMKVLLLSFPPDVSEEMRTAQFRFEKAMNTISKATSGYKKDLPVEIDSKSIEQAKQGWEEGRLALNEFFALINAEVGMSELKPIPSPGPNQAKEYGRSARRFNELQKKTKLCQNRGGPALSQAWGQLMVSGYLQDSCGIPDLEDYFYQKA